MHIEGREIHYLARFAGDRVAEGNRRHTHPHSVVILIEDKNGIDRGVGCGQHDGSRHLLQRRETELVKTDVWRRVVLAPCKKGTSTYEEKDFISHIFIFSMEIYTQGMP